MGERLTVAYSREVPVGSVAIGDETDDGKYEPEFYSDSLAGDLFVDGLIRKKHGKGKNFVVIFHSQEDIDENFDSLEDAVGDIVK